jgi:hypothetical protein
MSPRNRTLLVTQSVRDFHRIDIGIGNPHVLRLTAWVAAGQVRVAVKPSRGMPESKVGKILVSIGALAIREISTFTLLTL